MSKIYSELGEREKCRECVLNCLESGFDLEDMDQEEYFIGFHGLRYSSMQKIEDHKTYNVSPEQIENLERQVKDDSSVPQSQKMLCLI